MKPKVSQVAISMVQVRSHRGNLNAAMSPKDARLLPVIARQAIHTGRLFEARAPIAQGERAAPAAP